MVNILKANMYSLEDGEPSVFARETVSKAQLAAANGEAPARRNKVSNYNHLYCGVQVYSHSILPKILNFYLKRLAN